MLGDISGADNIYIICGTTDMRKSIDGLCRIVRDKLSMDPDQSSLFLFCGKRCDRIKVLLHELDGYVFLYKRLSVTHGRYPEKGSRMDRAVTYIRNRKDSLMIYLQDGRCSLSNNPSENSIRPVTLGRKNWLFSDTQDGANASMVVYTMVEMAKTHSIHPYLYLRYLLDSRPGRSTIDAEFEGLAPWSEKAKIECSKESE